MVSDTLHIDSAQIAAWQDDIGFDYNHEIVGDNENLLDWISITISRWVNETFETTFENEDVFNTLAWLGAGVVIAIGWRLLKKHVNLFYSKDREYPLDYEVVEDTIYGVDFAAELRKALENEDYRQAIRLVYLQTLLHLQKTGRIDWQPSKTPTQYMRQMGLPAFSQLTTIFVQVRYGNFEVSEALFQRMKTLQEEVIGEGGMTDE